ncbi:MAG: hypothetical protein Q9162_003229 [Coniocarpon cinnabarinum]
MRALHDRSIMFEEYYHYAQHARAEEEESRLANDEKRGILSTIFPAKSGKGAGGVDGRRQSLVPQVNTSASEKRATVSDEEWANASRAVRTASKGAVFYLITTDILGPYGLPYAFSSTGYGPGIGLYTAFGLMAGFSGWLLWQSFMGLDSYQFPVKSYGDLAFRLYGRFTRYGFNILQSIQLVCSVGLIIISSGEALSEITKFKLCYAVCCLIWALVGWVSGQIRTLQKFGWLANAAVWINLLIIFITMGVAANKPPLYSAYSSAAGYTVNPDLVSPDAAGNFPPIQHSAGLPNSGDFVGSVNGLMQAVYAYGGAMIFTEFMGEMKRPKDFLTAMWGAQTFIYLVYMFYGIFLYGYQGQYVQNPSYLGMSTYGWQTVGNILAIITAMIAAALYGNIGVKVLYNNIAVELFRAPPLTQRAGKIAWIFLIPVYWSIAYVIAAGIPDFSGFTSIVAASCILPFTYVFPPLLNVSLACHKNAIQAGEGFDPATGEVTRHDSGIKRWIRGFFSAEKEGGVGMRKSWGKLQIALNCFNIIYFLGALCVCALGMYAAIEQLIEAYATPEVNAFSCHSPLDSS